MERWEASARRTGVDMPFYANRERALDEVLPWDVIDVGVKKSHYIREYEQAHAGKLSPDCRAQCSACGASCLVKGGRCDG